MYKVLLVDDEALIREAISENTRWKELGYELMGTCKNGREAIERLDQEEADLVLTDICMPYVDGMELTRYLYEKHKGVKVIIISGYDDFEYAKTAVKYQVMDYILKPITAKELAQTLTRVKEKLDEERFQRSDMKRIRGAYMSNLPILRGRFLNSLLMGNVGAQEIQEKLKDYKIRLDGKYFMTALVTDKMNVDFRLSAGCHTMKQYNILFHHLHQDSRALIVRWTCIAPIPEIKF